MSPGSQAPLTFYEGACSGPEGPSDGTPPRAWISAGDYLLWLFKGAGRGIMCHLETKCLQGRRLRLTFYEGACSGPEGPSGTGLRPV